MRTFAQYDAGDAALLVMTVDGSDIGGLKVIQYSVGFFSLPSLEQGNNEWLKEVEPLWSGHMTIEQLNHRIIDDGWKLIN